MEDITVVDQALGEKRKEKNPTHNAKFVEPQKRAVKKFECSECHKEFKHRGVYNRHLITHSKEKPHVCEVCGKGFSRKHHLISHQMVHKSSEERAELMKFSCEECGKMFTRKEYLEQHSHSVEKIRVHDCPCCSKSFVQKSSLVRHLARHENKGMKCDMCDKYFFRSDLLREHQKTHKSEKKETCEQCGKSFNSKRYLNKHLMFHSQKRKYSCTICSKEFIQKCDLNRHRDIHSRILQDCEHCGKSISKDSMELHVHSCRKNPANRKVKARHRKKRNDKHATNVGKVKSCKIITLNDDSCEVFILDDYSADNSGSAIENKFEDKFNSVKIDTLNGTNPHSRTCTYSERVPFLFFGFNQK